MYRLSVILGKFTAWMCRHFGGGHGSALPGLVAEKLYPNFLKEVLYNLPYGVVLVSGTNGKTTTTKIIVDLLRADGYKVFTNPSGSNFTRGVASAALPLIRDGQLDADIAVLELDEAYAVKFAQKIHPEYTLCLNVLRDQLDRFGEIDHTADLLREVARNTRRTVILNEDDPRLKKIANDKDVKANVAWFGYNGAAGRFYRGDEELHGGEKKLVTKPNTDSSIRINDLQDRTAEYQLSKQKAQVKLRLFGIHNALNCAAALATIKEVEADKFNFDQAVEHLGIIKAAFGRGEVLTIGDSEVQLILVKNPSGFQLSLNSVSSRPTMIAINDDYADGRDVSWLWDVDFSSLSDTPVSTSGIRGYDMAIRLLYDNVDVDWTDTNLEEACHKFVKALNGNSGQIFATYTAMLKLRDILEKMAADVKSAKGKHDK